MIGAGFCFTYISAEPVLEDKQLLQRKGMLESSSTVSGDTFTAFLPQAILHVTLNALEVQLGFC